MHTDTACVQHVNVGLTQARPNYYLSYVVPYVAGRERTVRFSYNLQLIGSQLDPTAKVTLKDDDYERQSGKAAGACALIEQRILEVVFAATSRIGSRSVSIYCMYGLFNSCVERLKVESGRDPLSIFSLGGGGQYL